MLDPAIVPAAMFEPLMTPAPRWLARMDPSATLADVTAASASWTASTAPSAICAPVTALAPMFGVFTTPSPSAALDTAPGAREALFTHPLQGTPGSPCFPSFPTVQASAEATTTTKRLLKSRFPINPREVQKSKRKSAPVTTARPPPTPYMRLALPASLVERELSVFAPNTP